MKEENLISRRTFVQHLGFVGTGVVFFLSACTSEQQSGKGENGSSSSTHAVGPCSDLSELTEAEVQAREELDYVSDSPHPDQVCENCQFWIVPEAGQECGGCVVIKGPVHPKGFCNSWAPIT